jgi:UDP-GlcNAc:undecaprenyl-phosphate/decaprenyl-phosphate GlcNAc-1-phosphate transferase
LLSDKFYYFALLIVAFILAAVLTPLISKFATINNIVDQPGSHKIHLKPKPLLGGLAIFAGFAATLLLFLDLDDKLISMVIGTLVLVITGLLDDLFDLRPIIKLTGQTLAATIVVLWNKHLYVFLIEYFERFYMPHYVVLALIIIWIVLIVNAFNMIDGLDGLAAGTAAIIFAAMAALSIMNSGNPNILGVQLIALGACLGFLVYNFYPAKIFMGDTGSMLLGFILANTHLFTIKYPFDASLVLGSMFILAYPALDISFAIYRRLCLRCPIFKADRGHIHHLLRSLGFSVRKTVIIIYIANLFFASLALVLLGFDLAPQMLFFIGLLTFLFVILLFRRLLKINEKIIAK